MLGITKSKEGSSDHAATLGDERDDCRCMSTLFSMTPA